MKEITPKQVLAVRCPPCGAASGVRCELGTGQPRTEPPRDRRLIAAEKPGLCRSWEKWGQGIHVNLALTSGIRVKIYEVERPSEGISTVR
jgi:hypothetical protein